MEVSAVLVVVTGQYQIRAPVTVILVGATLGVLAVVALLSWHRCVWLQSGVWVGPRSGLESCWFKE